MYMYIQSAPGLLEQTLRGGGELTKIKTCIATHGWIRRRGEVV